VLIGSGVAAGYGAFSWWRALLALLVALALQVGVNYANDYSDGVRGTDATGRRAGPMRLVGSGAASPRAVKYAAFSCFFVACCTGLALAAVTSWWIVAAGALCVLAAWFYTGGSRPYGYHGLGEVFCFIFFGFVGTLGSTYVQHGSFTAVSALASLAVGALTTALLVANNLRDIPGDAATGKYTLAVKIGDGPTRQLYVALLGVAALATLAVVVLHPWALLAFVAAAGAVRPIQVVRSGATGRALIPVLIDTGRLELVFGILFAASVAVR